MIKIKAVSTLLIAVCIMASSSKAQKTGGKEKAATIQFKRHEAGKRVDVMVDGKLFTSYWWPDTVYKPVLYPILTSAGTFITRGFPIKPRAGERTDHLHQVGNWLNYGNVNGYDFWGNGSEGTKNPNGGQIKHLTIQRLTGGKGEGSMATTASWVDPTGKELLAEKTELHFIAKGPIRIIDRITSLTATAGSVTMKDTKEGCFAIRVARQLELPSKEDIVLTDGSGNPTTVKKMSNAGVTGNYRSSEGVTGEAVWGKRARWMNLYGSIGNEKVSLVMCDHPRNLNYPTYWHARGYGLFSANPFGVKDFTEGKEELNHVIPAGGTLTLRYRVVISSGNHFADSEINNLADDFGKKY